MKTIIILAIILLILFVGAGIIYYITSNNPGGDIVGGDKDEHGCIGSAGYAWCEAKGECLRPWEDEWDESCGVVPGANESLMNNEGEMMACTLEAKECSDGSFVGRVAPDCEFEACPNEATK